MYRGSREASAGILKTSMRDNYAEHGVDEYYRKVGATYRNPHFPGVCNTLFLWLNKWWQKEHSRIEREGFTVFDMACECISGEVTIALIQWWKRGTEIYAQKGNVDSQASEAAPPKGALTLQGKSNPFTPPALGPDAIPPRILAADPYTAEAFHTRTQLLHCSTLSFQDVAEGVLPVECLTFQNIEHRTLLNTSTFDTDDILEMTICSFALHLVDSPSELFGLLWQLSTKCRWLIVLAPHKRPEIKEGWGWSKWDINEWNECRMSDSKGELLQERVHCRVYRSLNVL